MRIISGKYKGKKILFPNKLITRPLRDRVKENIFNILQHSNKIQFEFKNSTVLDLFSGSGSFGLECLSREVEKVFFFEKNPEAFSILKKNLNTLNILSANAIATNEDVSFIQNNNLFNDIKPNLIFLDPPYEVTNIEIEKILRKIQSNNLLSKFGVIAIERDAKGAAFTWPEGFEEVKIRSYGQGAIHYGSHAQ